MGPCRIHTCSPRDAVLLFGEEEGCELWVAGGVGGGVNVNLLGGYLIRKVRTISNSYRRYIFSSEIADSDNIITV